MRGLRTGRRFNRLYLLGVTVPALGNAIRSADCGEHHENDPEEKTNLVNDLTICRREENFG